VIYEKKLVFWDITLFGMHIHILGKNALEERNASIFRVASEENATHVTEQAAVGRQ